MRDALGAVDLGEAAGEHRLGLVIERAQELRLPAVPHAGADRLMSAVVRMVSSFSARADCTTAAKFSIVLRSDRSRDCATLDMTRCCSTSQATVSVSAAEKPSRGQKRRATRAPAIE